jgi:anti-sigma B factor antagonist
MDDRLTAAEVREIGPVACAIDIRGDVTAASEEVLVAAYDDATARGAQAIVLSFTGLLYMNSGGIGLLVMLLVRAKRHEQRMLAYGLSDHYRQIFELTRLDEAIGIHDSEAAALAVALAPGRAQRS